jgi:acetylglutamate kinase
MVDEAIAKAAVLIEAMAWIRRFRDKVTIIKLGGRLLEDPDALRQILIDVVFMETVGMRPVIVHGGGSAISRALVAAGIESRFVQGRRVTDETTLQHVERALLGLNQQIAEQIEELGGRAMTLNFAGTNVLFGNRLKLNAETDLGFVGQVTRVDRTVIDNLCYADQIPVIPSMCFDESAKEKLNVNADTAAMAVAKAINAEKLVFLSDVNGVRTERNDVSSIVHTLSAEQAQEMIAAGAIESGMIPKVEACIETLHHGVGKIHIIDGRLRHSLLLEVYTNAGVGTEIVAENEIAQTG